MPQTRARGLVARLAHANTSRCNCSELVARTEALIDSHLHRLLPPRLIRTVTESMTYSGVEVL